MSDLSDTVAGRLTSWPRKTVRIEEIERLVVEQRPELAADGSRGTRIAEVVASLVGMGIVTASQRTAVRLGVRAPTTLTLTRRVAPPRLDPVSEWPWVEDLRWMAATELRQLRPHMVGRLKRLNTWLALHPDAEPAPERERSLDVFGDDKLLGDLLHGVLRGREPAGLRTYPVPPPMLLEETGSAERSVLIVENHTTWHSLLAVEREGQSPSLGWIGFGVGSQAPSLVASLVHIAPERLFYFGDLDWNGLDIAASTARAAAAVGLPVVRPHLRLYEMLLHLGRPQTRSGKVGWPESGLAWCGHDLRAMLYGKLDDDQWLAQEWVGRSALRYDRSWDWP